MSSAVPFVGRKGGLPLGSETQCATQPICTAKTPGLCTIVSASSWPLASEPHRTRRSTARERKPQAQQSTKATANGRSPVPTPPAQKGKQSQTKDHASKRANRKRREEERTEPKLNKSQNSQGANQSTTGTKGRPGKQQNETAERTKPSANRTKNQPNQAARCHSNWEPSQARGQKEKRSEKEPQKQRRSRTQQAPKQERRHTCRSCKQPRAEPSTPRAEILACCCQNCDGGKTSKS